MNTKNLSVCSRWLMGKFASLLGAALLVTQVGCVGPGGPPGLPGLPGPPGLPRLPGLPTLTKPAIDGLVTLPGSPGDPATEGAEVQNKVKAANTLRASAAQTQTHGQPTFAGLEE